MTTLKDVQINNEKIKIRTKFVNEKGELEKRLEYHEMPEEFKNSSENCSISEKSYVNLVASQGIMGSFERAELKYKNYRILVKKYSKWERF